MATFYIFISLRISSPTRNAEITSAKTLKLNSIGGEVSIEALNDLHFEATKVNCLDIFFYIMSTLKHKDSYKKSTSKLKKNWKFGQFQAHPSNFC